MPPSSTETGTDGALPSALRRFDDYELLDEIGRGGMGTVYRARQISLNRIVAIKVLPAGPLAAPARLARFRTEARAAGRLKHPHIVAVHEVGEADGFPFYSMDHIDGRTLADLTRDGPLAPREAARLMSLVAQAVAHAHEAGVLHRDLKPANIIVDRLQNPHVTDFGLAKELDASESFTGSREVFGSPGYMPPEQADPRLGDVTFASDVYSLGATLYHLLTGRAPFVAATPAATLQQVLVSEPAPAAALNPETPRDLETITLRCLAKEPSRRYPSAAAVADDLARFLGGEPIRARPVSQAERFRLWCRRRPVVAALSGVSLLLLLVVAIGSTTWAIQIQKARTAELASRDEIEANLYAADMAAVQQAYDEGNLGRAQSLLERHVPAAGQTNDRRGFEWHLFNKWSEGHPHSLVHRDEHPLIALALSPDRKSAAVASTDALKVIDLETRRQTVSWPLPHHDEARRVAWSPDGRLVASTERDGLHLHNVLTGERRVFASDPCDTVAFSPDSRRVAVCDALYSARNQRLTPISIRDTDSGLESGRLPDGGGAALGWEASGSALWIAGSKGAVSRWDLSGRAPDQRSEWSQWTTSGAFSDTGEWIGLFDWLGQLRILRTGEDKPVLILSNQAPMSGWISFDPTPGRPPRMALSGTSQSIQLVTAGTNAPVHLRGHSQRVTSHAFRSATNLISTAFDSQLLSWDLSPAPRPELLACDLAVIAVPKPQFADRGRLALIQTHTGGTNAFTLVRCPELSMVRRILGHFIGLTPDGGDMFYRSTRGSVVRESILTGRIISDMSISMEATPYPDRINATATLFGRKDAQDNVVIFTLPGLQPIATNSRGTWAFDFAPDAKTVLLATSSNIVAWDPATHLERPLIDTYSEELAFSPGGADMAIGSWDNMVRLVNLSSPATPILLNGHQGGVVALDFSPDGKTLASAAEDKTIRLWNLRTQRQVACLRRQETAYWLRFTPDGRGLMAGSTSQAELLDAR